MIHFPVVRKITFSLFFLLIFLSCSSEDTASTVAAENKLAWYEAYCFLAHSGGGV